MEAKGKKGFLQQIFFMQGKISVGCGKRLVRLARKSIEFTAASGRLMQEPCPGKKFEEKRGVFVTLHSFPEKELRGCIGLPYAVKPLWEAVQYAAAEAAFHDPRFSSVQASELESIVVEVSVLTKPEALDGEKEKTPEKINAGRDGLIVRRGGRSGLLLPQVCSEQNWDTETFLQHCCLKAGLPKESWKVSGTRVFRFQAQVFSEKEPRGEIGGKNY